MQLEEQTGGVKRSDCAVDGSDWIPFVFLSDALCGGKVELGQQRPSVAGVTSDRGQLVVGGLLGRAVQLLTQHSESRSDHDSREVTALDESVILIEHVLEVDLVVVVELRRHGSAEIAICEQCLVQVAHRGQSGLGSREIEERLQLRDLQGLLTFKQGYFCSHFSLSDGKQIIIIRAVVKDAVQRTHWQRLEAPVQRKFTLLVLFAQL